MDAAVAIESRIFQLILCVLTLLTVLSVNWALTGSQTAIPSATVCSGSKCEILEMLPVESCLIGTPCLYLRDFAVIEPANLCFKTLALNLRWKSRRALRSGGNCCQVRRLEHTQRISEINSKWNTVNLDDRTTSQRARMSCQWPKLCLTCRGRREDRYSVSRYQQSPNR